MLCWNCGFESHRRHGYLSVVNVVCCHVEVSATSWSLVWCVVVCDLETSRMTKAMTRVGSQRHKKVIINTMSFWTCITLHSLVLQEQTTMFLHSFPPVLKTYGLNCTKCFLQVCTHSNQKRFILPSVWIQVNTRQVAYRKEVLQVASAKGVRQNKRGQTRKGAFDPVR